MAELKKHIGVIKNTGTRVVVVFREVPDEPNSCLVTEIDRLPEKYYDKMQEFIINPVAKQTNDFYTFLHSRTFPDGLNALEALHLNRLLRKIDVDEVIMTPFPNQELPLTVLNQQINGVTEATSEVAPQPENPIVKEDHSQKSPEEIEQIAQGLMAQSELLKSDAKAKEDEAKALAPHLFKKSRGRPKKSAAEKSASDAAAKKKRASRDKAKKAEAKESSLDKSVMEKIERDLKRNG